MPDDHSKVVPLLPIPNRTVKRLCADDSADSRVKVGHRQALTATNTPSVSRPWGFWRYKSESPVRGPKKTCKWLTESKNLLYTARLRYQQRLTERFGRGWW
jgi:hypothetical protein